MANQITDGRTSVDPANAVGSYVGSTSPSLDTDVKIESTGSIGEQVTNSRRWVMYDDGATRDWSNNVFYVWINCGIVGLLDIKANGGFRIRFAGSTTSDFFEVDVGGSDDWPIAIEGGWVMFVVDIEDAHTNSDATGGTKPATNAIRYFGYSAITASVMTRTVDNTWMDASWRLPDGTAGILIEGRNAGTTDWDWDDVFTQLGSAAGTLKQNAAGSYVLNTSVQWGINDTSTHGFTDTNKIILLDNQEFIPTDLYKFTALGNAGGTTNVTLGVKTGTGDDATGAQGCIFAADAAGVRYDMDFDDPNLDSIGLYGCQFIHGGDFQLDDPAVSAIGNLFLDCTSASVANCADFLRNSVIDPNVAGGVAFLTTDDISDIVFNTFESNGVGHAVELVTPLDTAQINKGNLFVGYDVADPGTANNKAVYNNQAGSIVISSTNGSNLTEDFHVRNGTSAATDVQANISVTFDGMRDNSEVWVFPTTVRGIGNEIAHIENVTAGTVDDRSYAWSASSGTVVDYKILHYEASGEDYETIEVIGYTVPTTDVTVPIAQRVDLNSV